MSPRSAGYWLSWRRIIVLSRALSQPCFFSRPSSDPPTLDELRLLDTRSWGLGSIGASPRKPRHSRHHSAPSEKTHECGDLGVVLQQPQDRKNVIPIVLRDIRIAHRHQWQIHGSRIRHIAGRVEPVLEKKEYAESSAGQLSLKNEIPCKEQRHQPLQNRPAPDAQRRPKPSKQQMAAFMDDQIRRIHKQIPAVLCKYIGQEGQIENDPSPHRPSGKGLPIFTNQLLRMIQDMHLQEILAKMPRSQKITSA